MENRDFKYIIQDITTLYLGSKYSFRELIEDEDIPFKLKMIFQKHLSEQMDSEDTLEGLFYYMRREGFVYQIFKQLQVKLKISEIVEKKSIFGKKKKEYMTKNYSLADFIAIPEEEKKRLGMVIIEISISKLALMGFSL